MRNRLLKNFIHLAHAYNNASAVNELIIALRIMQSPPRAQGKRKRLPRRPGQSQADTHSAAEGNFTSSGVVNHFTAVIRKLLSEMARRRGTALRIIRGNRFSRRERHFF